MDERTMGADAYGTWSTDALVGSSVQVWSDHDRIHGLAHHHIWVLSCMDRILWGWGLLVCLFLLRAWVMTCWVLSLRTDHKRLIVTSHTIYIFVHVTINYMCCQFHILPTRAGTVSSYEMWQLCPPRSPFIFCVSLTSTIFWWAEDQSQFHQEIHIYACMRMHSWIWNERHRRNIFDQHACLICCIHRVISMHQVFSKCTSRALCSRDLRATVQVLQKQAVWVLELCYYCHYRLF